MKTFLPVKTIKGKYCYKTNGHWYVFGDHFPNKWTKVLGEDRKLINK